MKSSSVFFVLLTRAAMVGGADSIAISHEYCDTNALPAESTRVETLSNGQFYKLCPGSHQHSDGNFTKFGQPRCGDGSNFAFYLTRPEQPQIEEQKILLELSGGGACWDKTTCGLQKPLLKMPPIDFVLGMSCSDLGAIADASKGWDMLCARTVGQTDFTEYNTVVIPYCTQDIHLGDAEAFYDGINIRHVGAHNAYRTLQWIFDNFDKPSHIVLTGCSAGASPLPVIYRMIKEHYKAEGVNVDVDIIADSPVYLTPKNFVENYFQSWNHGTVMESIGFDYETYKTNTQYPSVVMDYVLDRSDENDGFGMISHKVDQVSIMYYAAMGGKGEWWGEMNETWSQAKTEHQNFDIFIMDGSGHCSSGLYFANQQNNFDTWVSKIIDETSSSASISDAQLETMVTNTSVTTTNGGVNTTSMTTTNPTDDDTSEAHEYVPLDSQAQPSSTKIDASNTATLTTNAIIATTLCFHLSMLLLW